MHIKTGTKYHLNTLLNNYNQTEKEIPPSEVTFFTSFFFFMFSKQQQHHSVSYNICMCTTSREKKKLKTLWTVLCQKEHRRFQKLHQG